MQSKIVKILFDIENKINTNNQINNNLSEQIKSIYNEIFTEFIGYIWRYYCYYIYDFFPCCLQIFANQ